MNAPGALNPLDFIDLKTQYAMLREGINARIQRVLDHDQYIIGTEFKELEDNLAALTGSKHCMAAASGTEALLISLIALSLKAGDEVATTPCTFAPTTEMIVLASGTPVFVDIEAGTCHVDASKIEAAITPRTRVIMPMSQYGRVADMDEINAIAARHGNIRVIEDAAQIFRATYKGRKSCNLSTVRYTSFVPSKPLGCYGDDAAIFTGDDALARARREIHVHGQTNLYHHTRVGVRGRMDTQQRMVVLGKLKRFARDLAHRLALGDSYATLLVDVPGLRHVVARANRACVWAEHTMFVSHRNRIQGAPSDLGIPTAVRYPKPLNLQPTAAELCRPECCPESVEAGDEIAHERRPILRIARPRGRRSATSPGFYGHTQERRARRLTRQQMWSPSNCSHLRMAELAAASSGMR